MRTKKRRWTDKPAAYETAFRGNRRLSERIERTHLRGLDNASKIHPLKCATYNLGLLMRHRFGLRKLCNADAGR